MDEGREPAERWVNDEAVSNAADGLLKAFRANGVEYFFSSPGSEFATLWEQFAHDTAAGIPTSEHGIGYIACAHEELAMHMAMGHTMRSGRPQVVGLHVNIGSLHAAMSIHGAHSASLPVVILTSHADTHENEVSGGTPGSHYINFNSPGGFEDHFVRYVKWVCHPENIENIGNYLGRGFQLARTVPRGPVLANIAREHLFNHDVERMRLLREPTPTPPAPASRDLERLVERLTSADNPIIISGRTSQAPAATPLLVALSEALEAPVIEKPKWHNGFPSDHPLSLGSNAFVDHFLGLGPDLVLVIGSSRPWYPPQQGAPDDAEIVWVSPRPGRPDLDYWNYPADLLVHGDPVATLEELLDSLPRTTYDRSIDWRGHHEALRSHWLDLAEAGRDDTPIDPYWLCLELDRVLPDDAIVVSETTDHSRPISNLITTQDRYYVKASNYLAGGRGGSLGMTLGAKLAAPDRPAVTLVGDGALLYNPVAAAFEASRAHGLPSLTIVFNNRGYRSQKKALARTYPEGRAVRSDRYPGIELGAGDLTKLADAWDMFSETVRDPADIGGAVGRGLEALEGGDPGLIDVVLSEETPRIGPPPT